MAKNEQGTIFGPFTTWNTAMILLLF